MNLNSVFKCPICQKPLVIASAEWHCRNLHQFDVAKTGYINLVAPHQKNSKEPGDSKEMVQARYQFLEKGYYIHFSEALNQMVMNSIGRSHELPFQVLDVGCGEGYFLQQLKTEMVRRQDPSSMYFCGMDVSKPAIQKASKRDRVITWCVGNIFDLPILSHTQDLLMNVFSPYGLEEFHRVLKPSSGLAFFAVQGEDHLIELRQKLYENATFSESQQRFLSKIKSFHGFCLQKKKTVKKKIHLESNEDILCLIRMTPYYWHMPMHRQEVLKQLKSLDVTTHMEIYAFVSQSIERSF